MLRRDIRRWQATAEEDGCRTKDNESTGDMDPNQ